MGDENLNNSDDTSLLFVSGQRKKQAEDEAKRKEEEEKARKESQEAEILRREAEMSKRKGKAEVLKQRLEKSEQERNKHKKMNILLPVAIGIIAAFIVIIGALVSPKPEKAYEEVAEFNAEYTPNDAGYGIKLKYPDTVFEETTENPAGENLDIVFTTSGKDLSMNVLLAKTEIDKISKNIKWREINDKLKADSLAFLQGAEIIEESGSIPEEIYTGTYFYQCTYTKDGKSGAYYGWCAADAAGNVLVEGVDCKAGENDIESAVKLRDQFFQTNSENAIKVPGSYEPEDKEYKGRLKVDCPVKLNVPVPENMFTEVAKYSNDQGLWQEWVDENGAIILVGSLLFASADESIKITTSNLPTIYGMYDTIIEDYLKEKVNFTEREKSGSTKNAVYINVDSKAKYLLKVNGREYVEDDYAILLLDGSGNYYCELIYMLTPRMKNAIYTPMAQYCFEHLTVDKQ